MARLFGILIIGVFAVGVVAIVIGAGRDGASVPAASPSAENDGFQSVSSRTACDGGEAIGDVVAVTGDYEMRVAPSDSADRIKNEKLSKALGGTFYQKLDSSESVRRLCAGPEWTFVQVVSPEWLTDVKGWVPNVALRGIERTASGARVYHESDIYWDGDTSPFKPQIVQIINRIARENAGCSSLDTGTVAKSASRSTSGDPVFFVTCGTMTDAFNVWFRPSDAENSRTFASLAPIERADAILACEQAAKDAANHPSTVDFSRFLDVAYSAFPSGRATVESTFTAKNSFNLKIEHRVRCVFDGQTLIETDIQEAG